MRISVPVAIELERRKRGLGGRSSWTWSWEHRQPAAALGPRREWGLGRGGRACLGGSSRPPERPQPDLDGSPLSHRRADMENMNRV
ncbi:hypothetical protein PCANC_02656 [Puccinia coronata f. sp. avenae]|uniref:Uncharacterized protein n=1 Tax=Puccinia coronata f. sp. avenae TaxID=200324 RepID=A0A2N5W5D5_9BASI|nr:hypothetical protein PCANC_02656 [Puccinia coronata f. sp. avenae]